MEEYSVYGSEEEEEADDPRDGETDEDLTDEERDNQEVVIPLFQCQQFPLVFCFWLFHTPNTLKSNALNVLMYPESLQIDAGSVDEHSTKSDEEYEDLAMRDVMDNGDWSDDEQAGSTKNSLAPEGIIRGRETGEDDGMEGLYHHNLDLFLKMSKEVASTRMPCAS